MCHKSCVTWHVSNVMCHMSYVTCHVSNVMCHLSCVTYHVSHVMCHMPCVTCHVSHVMCHMSRVTCHMSRPLPRFFMFWFLFLFWDFTKQLILEITFATSLLLMMGELAGGGSVAVAVCVTVRWQATCDSLLSAMSVCLSVFFSKNVFQFVSNFFLPLVMFLLVLS